jgi:hypothetical protein
MALSPYSGPRIRVRANVRIPARVVSGPGISQEIADGVLTTGLDLTELDPVVSIPDPSLYRLFVYNEGTDTWETTTLDNLPTTTTGDTYTGRGDAIYTFLSTDRYVELTTALTAARIWSLPVASTYPAGTRIVVQDAIGGITSTNTLTIQANAADTINGAATFVLNAAYTGVELRSDGTDKWSARVINDGSVGTAKLADGALAASTAGLAKMADGYLAASTAARLKMADKFVVNAKLDDMAQATFKMRAAAAGTGVPIDGTPAQLRAAAAVLATAEGGVIAAASQTIMEWASIPAGVSAIEISISALSTNGNSDILVQIGDSGGHESSGYAGTTALIANSTSPLTNAHSAGFIVIAGPGAAAIINGVIRLVLLDASTNTWAASGGIGLSNAPVVTAIGGSKSLSATLDRIRLIMANATDVFDAGKASIRYEYP